jgi:hypothetical protein
MRARQLFSVGAGLVSVGLLLLLAVSGALPRLGHGRPARTAAARPAGTYASYLQVVGVPPRDVDPATRGTRRDGDAWVLGGVDLEQARALADDPQDLDVLAHGDERWIPTQTWKLQHGGASEFAVAKEHCSMRHLVTMADTCVNDLAVVVERTGDREGRVVYARPRPANEQGDECRAYADCTARDAWLGRPTPLPPGDEPLYGFKAGDVTMPLQGSKDELRAGFEDAIRVSRKNLSVLRRMPEDPFTAQNIALNEDLLAYHEWLLSL